MDRWPHKHITASIIVICKVVDDPDWQRFRKSLKGLPTTQKLDKLDEYLYLSPFTDSGERKFGEHTADEIRVSNYIGALRRGGFLNSRNEVIK